MKRLGRWEDEQERLEGVGLQGRGGVTPQRSPDENHAVFDELLE